MPDYFRLRTLALPGQIFLSIRPKVVFVEGRERREWLGQALRSVRGAVCRSVRHKKRRHWAPLYLRGLLLPGERKSIEPLAARVAPGHDQELRHFVSESAWDEEAIEQVLLDKADTMLGGDVAMLIIDDTALPKKGTESVGVAHQYCGALGKQANCQSLVSLTLAKKDVPVPISLPLYLPEAWRAIRGGERRRAS